MPELVMVVFKVPVLNSANLNEALLCPARKRVMTRARITNNAIPRINPFLILLFAAMNCGGSYKISINHSG
jgi:hypothetical protein